MASRLDSMRNQFQLGGQTVQTSAEEIQGLSARSGRQAPPTQPMETAVIGGTPSQAKMAGSSASLGTATRMSLEGTQQLPDYLRKLQATMPLTEVESGRIARARAMGNLNSMEERVNNAALATLAPTRAAVLVVNDANLPKTLVDVTDGPSRTTTRTDTIALLKKFGEGKDLTQQEWSTLVTNLGYDGDTRKITDIASDIRNKYFKTAQESLADAATGSPDNVLMSALNPVDLGFESWEKIRALLNLPEGTDISTMTVKQFTDQISKVQAQEYSRTSALIRIINDPNVAPRDKEAARQQLAQLGSSGILSAEAEVSNLADQIDDINTVTIAGREYTISELLSDKTITSLIDDYLKDPVKAKEIRESSKSFADWIDANKDDLQKNMDKLDPGIKLVSDTIKENNSYRTPVTGGETLKDDVMTTLFGAGWKTSTTAYNVTQYPLIGLLKSETDTSIPTPVKLDLVRLMNSLSGRTQDIQDLAKMTPQQLAAKGLMTVDGVKTYIDYINTSANIAGPMSPNATIQGLVGNIFGDAISFSAFKKLLEDVKLINDTNLVDDLTPAEYAVLKIFDADGDGEIDNLAEVRQRAQDVFSGKSLKDLVNGANDINSGKGLFNTLKEKVDKAQSDGFFLSYKDVLADGKIGEDEIATPALQNASVSDLQYMIDKKVPGAAKLQSLISDKSSVTANQLIGNDTINLLNSTVDSFLNFRTMDMEIPWNSQNVTNWTKGLNNILNGKKLGTFDKQPASVVDAIRLKYNNAVTTMQRSLDSKKQIEYETWENEYKIRKENIERNLKNAKEDLSKLQPGSRGYIIAQQRVDRETNFLNNILKEPQAFSQSLTEKYAKDQQTIDAYKNKF